MLNQNQVWPLALSHASRGDSLRSFFFFRYIFKALIVSMCSPLVVAYGRAHLVPKAAVGKCLMQK